MTKLTEHVTTKIEFEQAAARIGDNMGDFFDARRELRSRFSLSLLEEPLKELPQVSMQGS
jgi:hypothetical protein